MVYLIVSLLILACIITWIQYRQRRDRQLKLDNIKDKWSKVQDTEHNFNLIAPYYHYCNTGSGPVLDEGFPDTIVRDALATSRALNQKYT